MRHALLLSLLLSGVAAAAEPLTLDSAYLNDARQKVAKGDTALAAALAQVVKDADAVLAKRVESVTYKRLMPPSGDKHDYMSFAPYWWPDPGKPGGLPYRQRDGEFNPSAQNDDTDSSRMYGMCEGTYRLSLAYYFTGRKQYASRIAAQVKAWFLDPATRMHPNLQFGQAIMGKVEGRGIGLIDTRNLWMVIDAVALTEDAGALAPADVAALKQWFREFADWMERSKLGQDEAAAANNHGMFYDAQLAGYALFVGDAAKAKRIVDHALKERIAVQVEADGKQPHELARTTPFHYSAFNLEAMTKLARYGEQLGWMCGKRSRAGTAYAMPLHS